MKDVVGVQVAKVDAVVVEQIVKEGMKRNPHSSNKIGLKMTTSWVLGVGNASPAMGCHPAVSLLMRMPSMTNWLRSSSV